MIGLALGILVSVTPISRWHPRLGFCSVHSPARSPELVVESEERRRGDNGSNQLRLAPTPAGANRHLKLGAPAPTVWTARVEHMRILRLRRRQARDANPKVLNLEIGLTLGEVVQAVK